MKKHRMIYIIPLTILLLATFAAAAAAETVVGKTLQYADIAAMVRENNLNLKAARLTVGELEDALADMDDYNDAVESQRGSLSAVIGDLQAQLAAELAAGNPDEAKIGELQKSLSFTQQTLSGIQTLDTLSTERGLAMAKAQVKQVEMQLILAAQHVYLLLLQTAGQEAELAEALNQAEKAYQAAQIRARLGLLPQSALSAAEAGKLQAEAALEGFFMQRQNLQNQLHGLLGLGSNQTPLPGDAPKLLPARMNNWQPEEDAKQAVKNSLAIKVLKAERGQTESAAGKKRVDLMIALSEQQTAQELLQQEKAAALAVTALEIAEKSLAAARAEMQAAELKYGRGLLSETAMTAARTAARVAENARTQAELELFWQLELYDAVVNGWLPEK